MQRISGRRNVYIDRGTSGRRADFTTKWVASYRSGLYWTIRGFYIYCGGGRRLYEYEGNGPAN